MMPSTPPSGTAGPGSEPPDTDAVGLPPVDSRHGDGSDGLPEGPQPLDPRVILVWRVGLALRTLLYAAVALGLDMWLDPPVPRGILAGAVLLVGGILTLLLPPLQHRHWRYELRDRLVVLQHGVLWRTTTMVPHTRIQHVDTQRGPMERWLGLSRLVLHTAAIRGGELEVPGLLADAAEPIRDHLARASGIDDAL